MLATVVGNTAEWLKYTPWCMTKVTNAHALFLLFCGIYVLWIIPSVFLFCSSLHEDRCQIGLRCYISLMSDRSWILSRFKLSKSLSAFLTSPFSRTHTHTHMHAHTVVVSPVTDGLDGNTVILLVTMTSAILLLTVTCKVALCVSKLEAEQKSEGADRYEPHRDDRCLFVPNQILLGNQSSSESRQRHQSVNV